MKIGIVAENYFPTLGGIQEHIYFLTKQLISSGHDVAIITGRPKVERWMGPEDTKWVIRVGHSHSYRVMGTVTQFTLGPLVAKRLKTIFQENMFDVLHIHGPFDFGLPMLAYALFKGPKVATLHSSFKDSFFRQISKIYYKWVIKKTDALIAVSQHAANSLLRYASFPYSIIPNGVDVEGFQKGKKIQQYNDGRKNILYLGRVEPRNGLDILFLALPHILKENPNVRVLVGGDGPQLEKYKKILSHDLKKHVKFLGAVYDERADLYKTADLFVLPNRVGGTFSIMVLEALASGTPVVSTPFVPQDCRNDHWKSVVICQDHSPESLAKEIINTLEMDQSERIESGRERVKKYDWSQVAKEIIKVYHHSLSTPSKLA